VNDATAPATAVAAKHPLTYLTIEEAGRLIAAKKLSPVELIDAHLARIAELSERLSAYITVVGEQARDQARAAERDIMSGRRKGPLHGIPYGLKDNYYTKGVRTTAASRLMWDWVPNTDATLHARLREAGAILLGKHNTWEYGTGLGEPQTDLPIPAARIAWNPDYFAGGSSSGTGVSVATGMAMLGLGSDTGGSVRVPAAVHGLFGLKPTYGLLSRAGILPNSFSLDAAGPITRTVRDTAIALQHIAGVDANDPTTVDRPVPDYAADLDKGVKGLKLGVIRRFHERDTKADAEVVAGIESTIDILRRLGAEIVELDVPHTVQDYRLVTRIIGNSEALSLHEKDFRERQAEMGTVLREKFVGSLGISALDYIKATRWRREMTLAIDAAVAQCDAVICAGPCVKVPPIARPDLTSGYMIASGTCVFNVSGHPAASICTGFDADGLPTSVQIAAKYWDEAMLLRVAQAYEQATQWHRRHPH
jgi:aspartyl-tRNA(Asn)/glutamyl-tRNA(Gln) amidotransferase subunit A